MNAPTEKFALARRGLPLATAAHATLRGARRQLEHDRPIVGSQNEQGVLKVAKAIEDLRPP